MTLTPKYLEQKLRELALDDARPRRLWVAFSGGADSAVLLHLASHIRGDTPLIAVHVDHGLHADSRQWAKHAETFATSLGAEFVGMRRSVSDIGSGIEAAAREARYECFESVLEDGDWLMSAHHQDDQAETLLLNLLRGSGVLGLAGIAARRPCGAGTLVRPLLDVSRQTLLDYADGQRIAWIEDPSNSDSRFDRNFLRNEVLPGLRSRWPALGKRLTRSAELAGEASDLLDVLAAQELAAAGRADRLNVAALKSLSPARQRNLLRFAVRSLGLPPLPASRLQEILSTVLDARDDAQPRVEWAGAEARRYRGILYLHSVASPILVENGRLLPGQELALGPGLGRLSLVRAGGRGINPQLAEAGLLIRCRDGGERLRPAAGAATRTLKSLLQDAGILPWMRDRIPLLVHNERLVAVADLWTESDACSEDGYSVHWAERPAVSQHGPAGDRSSPGAL
jgi:tRNA(Ile)-lysidine synthase